MENVTKWLHTDDANTFVCMIALSYVMIMKVSDACFLNLDKANKKVDELEKKVQAQAEEIAQLKMQVNSALPKTPVNSALPKTPVNNPPSKAPIAEKSYDITRELKTEQSRVTDLLNRTRGDLELLKKSNDRVKAALYEIGFDDLKKAEKETQLLQELKEINAKRSSALKEVLRLEENVDRLASVDPDKIKRECEALIFNTTRTCNDLTSETARECKHLISEAERMCDVLISTALQTEAPTCAATSYMNVLTQPSVVQFPASFPLPASPPSVTKSRRELKKR